MTQSNDGGMLDRVLEENERLRLEANRLRNQPQRTRYSILVESINKQVEAARMERFISSVEKMERTAGRIDQAQRDPIEFLLLGEKFKRAVTVLSDEGFFTVSPDGRLDFLGSSSNLKRICRDCGLSSWKALSEEVTVRGKRIDHEKFRKLRPSWTIGGKSGYPAIREILKREKVC